MLHTMQIFTLTKATVFICFIILNNAFAQEKSRFKRQDKIWADVGLGIAENTGLVFNTALNYQRNRLILTGQHLRTDEFSIDARPSQNSQEIAIMGGWANRYKYFSIAAQAGPSIQSGMKRGEFIKRVEGSGAFDFYESDPYKNTLGLSTQIQGFINLKYVGLGGKIFSTINKEKTFWGVGLNLSVGKLR